MNNFLSRQTEQPGRTMSSVQESVQDDRGWPTLLEHVYGASETDRRVFAVVADADGPATADEVADRIERHRSTASRSLTRLVDAGLVERMTREDSGPSYRFVYRMRDADALADEMHRLLTAWHVRMGDRLAEFERQSEPAFRESV